MGGRVFSRPHGMIRIGVTANPAARVVQQPRDGCDRSRQGAEVVATGVKDKLIETADPDGVDPFDRTA